MDKIKELGSIMIYFRCRTLIAKLCIYVVLIHHLILVDLVKDYALKNKRLHNLVMTRNENRGSYLNLVKRFNYMVKDRFEV